MAARAAPALLDVDDDRDDARVAQQIDQWNKNVKVVSVTLPGNPAVQVKRVDMPDIQCQWEADTLMPNFYVQSNWKKMKDRIRENWPAAEKFHKLLWPDGEVPSNDVVSKHVKLEDGDASKKVFLKKITMPTSVAFAWMAFAICHPKRTSESRERAWNFLAVLLEHCIDSAGRMEFYVQKAGDIHRSTTKIVLTYYQKEMDCKQLWTRTIFSRIVAKWRTCCEDDHCPISSDIENPTLVDFLHFAMSPATERHGGSLLRPAAFSILAQFAHWLDTNMEKVALHTSDFHYNLDKNRMKKSAALDHSLWAAIDFMLHENAPWHAGELLLGKHKFKNGFS